MIKSKLLKAIVLGLCMSALSTGLAFASSDDGSSPASEEQQTDATNFLYEKQREIDQYVFKDHVSEIEEKGFAIVYTGVADTYVEIGITPFDDSNAKYLYDIFGSEDVKVVASEEAAVLTTTEVAPDKSVTNDVTKQPLDDQIYTTMELSPDTAVTGTDDAVDPNLVDKVYKGEPDVNIQIESTDGEEAPMDPSVIYQTGIVEEGQEDLENQVVSATDDSAIAEGNVVNDSDSKGLSTPIIILIIAGGAVLIGGSALLFSKKKEIKK